MHLGEKIAAVPKSEWHYGEYNFPGHKGEALRLPGDAIPIASLYRRRIGKGMGIDSIHPHVIKCLPDEWLTSIPTCFANSFRENDIAGADWNSQKLVPIPKLNKAK
eukprot:2322615-Amphidinium_carterae.1